jgi:hypothetical protein
MNNNRTLFPMLCLCLPLLCFTASTGNAAESSDSESWEFAHLPGRPLQLMHNRAQLIPAKLPQSVLYLR